MTFKPRTRRVAPASEATVLRRRIERAVVDPHDARERFHPDFVVALVCEVCGRVGTTTIRERREAIRDHVQGRHASHDGPVVIRVVFPRQ